MHVEEFISCRRGDTLNRAISGDTTAGALERVRSSFPDGAAVALVLLGYNDLAEGASLTDTAARVEEVCRLLLARYATEHVIVESLLPADDFRASTIVEFNSLIRRFADRQPSMSYLDLYSVFLTEDVRNIALFAGEVHLNERGVLVRLREELEHLNRVAPDLRGVLTLVTGSEP